MIQSRSEDSILARDRDRSATRRRASPASSAISAARPRTCIASACKSREIEAACRKPSCVYPDICDNLGTDHTPLVTLYRKARALPGVKRIFIASGVRYDLAVRSPEYVKELAQHHTGGYLKIAPEHTEEGPLAHMMKPGIGALRSLQGAVRSLLAGGGQRAVPDPVLHRRASRAPPTRTC